MSMSYIRAVTGISVARTGDMTLSYLWWAVKRWNIFIELGRYKFILLFMIFKLIGFEVYIYNRSIFTVTNLYVTLLVFLKSKLVQTRLKNKKSRPNSFWSCTKTVQIYNDSTRARVWVCEEGGERNPSATSCQRLIYAYIYTHLKKTLAHSWVQMVYVNNLKYFKITQKTVISVHGIIPKIISFVL